MKITKRQLRRIIKEEKARLFEAWGSSSGAGQSPADRGTGLYFDVKMMQQLGSLMDSMFHNAMDAARKDGVDDQQAYEMILAGFRQLVEDEIMEMRY
ncbi:hypothetical protein CMI47_08740 [Candidatus Pacearchaeota archaeon]|nr:hypothetical protein [Candidatus Pacearchaeota archaeon]|tara:strand:- start:956 stop:1246 length:291 start_codon:yes stop_codon:yes gene_type:complete